MHKSLAKKDIPVQQNYPDKLFYKIGEVSKIAGVEPYVLRYWETEFQFLKPRKSKSGQRIYVKKDLELIFQIKELLYKERFTIEGVRKKFSETGNLSKPLSASTPIVEPLFTPNSTVAKSAQEVATALKGNPDAETLKRVKSRLKDILAQLS